MRLLLPLLVAVLALCPAYSRGGDGFRNPSAFPDAYKTEGNVYICTSPKAYAYHSDSWCRGLNNCNYSIKLIPASKARSMGRRPCKKCY